MVLMKDEGKGQHDVLHSGLPYLVAVLRLVISVPEEVDVVAHDALLRHKVGLERHVVLHLVGFLGRAPSLVVHVLVRNVPSLLWVHLRHLGPESEQLRPRARNLCVGVELEGWEDVHRVVLGPVPVGEVDEQFLVQPHVGNEVCVHQCHPLRPALVHGHVAQRVHRVEPARMQIGNHEMEVNPLPKRLQLRKVRDNVAAVHRGGNRTVPALEHMVKPVKAVSGELCDPADVCLLDLHVGRQQRVD
mmetsp:Transcript_27576/g.65703  ORF Transcript_27576/g.65703 Transcript_27576/m.65703 type:complete len:245 (-) Transcript_27576:553-1287(-)